MRRLIIGIVRLGEMRNDQPTSKHSIIFIVRSSCSRICRKIRSAMPWSWNSDSHAAPPPPSVKGYASDDMEHNYRRAKDLLQENSSPVHQFRAMWGLWVFHLVKGQLANAHGLAENLLSLANREQSSYLLIKSREALGSTYFFLGRFDEARTHLFAAKSLHDPNQHRSHTLLYGQDPGDNREDFAGQDIMDIR